MFFVVEVVVVVVVESLLLLLLLLLFVLLLLLFFSFLFFSFSYGFNEPSFWQRRTDVAAIIISQFAVENGHGKLKTTKGKPIWQWT